LDRDKKYSIKYYIYGIFLYLITQGGKMRLDKFFKVSRIIKRRPVAKTVLDNKKVKLNGRIVKAGTLVSVGDIIELEYFSKYMKVEVLEIPTGNTKKDDADELFKILEVKEIEVE
jgi:ribosomal 50S subunit-recycling heat shock protein